MSISTMFRKTAAGYHYKALSYCRCTATNHSLIRQLSSVAFSSGVAERRVKRSTTACTRPTSLRAPLLMAQYSTPASSCLTIEKGATGVSCLVDSSNNNFANGPVREYEFRVENGQFIDDSFQRSIVDRLQRLYIDLLNYKPSNSLPHSQSGFGKGIGFLSKLFGQKSSDAPMPDVPKGLYIYGDVGTGKTTTMDLFFESIPSEIKKRRIHFHAFMLDVHSRIQSFKHTHSAHDDPIPTIARELSQDAYVLCFDEFQVTDIADAMVLRRLVTELFHNGVIIVTTSNRHPDQLYKNGIQRESFVPCIELLKSRCEVVSLDSGTDYRKIARESGSVYFSPINADINKILHVMFSMATEGAAIEHDAKITFLGRHLTIPIASSNGVAKFTFNQLCKDAHSAADYIELTKHYNTIFLTDVPVMHMSDRNEARRFITLIDALYESHSVLVMSSEKDIFNLFTGSNEMNRFIESHITKITEGNEASDNPDQNKSLSSEKSTDNDKMPTMFTGEEEVFAFQRAISRLVEMSSRSWLMNGRNIALAENALSQEGNTQLGRTHVIGTVKIPGHQQPMHA